MMISKLKEFIFKVCKGAIVMLGQFFKVLLTDITNVAILGWLCIILGHWSLCGKIRSFEVNTKYNWSTTVQSWVLDWKFLTFL